VDFIILFLRLEPRALICDLFFSEGKYRFWVASLLRHEPELRIGKKGCSYVFLLVILEADDDLFSGLCVQAGKMWSYCFTC